MPENILHFGGARFRINGNGNMRLRFIGLDGATDNVLLPINIVNNGREPLRQSNFVSQRARLEIKTTDINEIIRINRIVIFARPIFFDFPSA